MDRYVFTISELVWRCSIWEFFKYRNAYASEKDVRWNQPTYKRYDQCLVIWNLDSCTKNGRFPDSRINMIPWSSHRSTVTSITEHSPITVTRSYQNYTGFPFTFCILQTQNQKHRFLSVILFIHAWTVFIIAYQIWNCNYFSENIRILYDLSSFLEKAIRFLAFVYIKIHRQQADKYQSVLHAFSKLFWCLS